MVYIRLVANVLEWRFASDALILYLILASLGKEEEGEEGE